MAQTYNQSEYSSVLIQRLENLVLIQEVPYMGERELPAILQSRWPESVFASFPLKHPQLFWQSRNLQKIFYDLEALVQTYYIVKIEVNGVINWRGLCIYGFVASW